MTDGEIDYGSYSDYELRQAFLSIDRERFPRNFENLKRTMHARLVDADVLISDKAIRPDEPETQEGQPEVVAFLELLARLTPRTPVTYALIAINVAVFAAMAADGAGILDSNGEVHVRWGSNFAPLTVDGEWWRLGSAMFLHFGVIHLLLNMWVLYANGRMVERMFGSGRFLLLYLFAGLTGSLASAAWQPAANSAGASGAIFGVLGGMAAFLAARKTRVPQEVLRAQSRSVGAFVVYNLVFGLTHPGIDNAAHLGGLIGGFAIGLALARPLTSEAREEPRTTFVAGVLVSAAFVIYATTDLVLYLKGRMSPEDRFSASLVWFGYREAGVLAAYDDLIRQGQAGKINDGEFADQLNAGIVAFYSEAQERFATAEDPDGAKRELKGQLVAYLDMRLRSVSMFESALREKNSERVREAMALQREADALAAKFVESGAADEAP